MAKKSARSKTAARPKKAAAKRPAAVKKAKSKPAPRRAPKSKKPVTSASRAAMPAPPKQKPLRQQMLEQISALAITLEDNSLKKLLQDAAILAHNEQVIREFIEEKDSIRLQASSVLADVEEGKDGTYYIVVLKGYRHIFGIEEMRNLVKTCHAAGTASEGGPRLFAWMQRERRDILMNSKIADQTDPCLSALREMIVSTYAARD